MSHEETIDLEGDINKLLDALPLLLSSKIRALEEYLGIIEIVLDLGVKPQVRFLDRDIRLTDLSDTTIDDINYIVSRLGSFNLDNRAGIERTLHRISAIRNRAGKILGLTLRVGRAILGSIEMISDIIKDGKNILILGAPGVGKTTKLREAARFLSDDMHKRVMIVDTSNEIAGEGDISHSGIGTARRMQVPQPDHQHHVMIEAVENHMPEVIIVDEIGTEEEAKASRTIAERGVQLLATAHGHTLENVIKNPTLSDLLGGIQSVILGDEEAKFRGTQKTVLERKSLPTFDVLIELRDRFTIAIYNDVQSSVDNFLRSEDHFPIIREFINNEWVTKEENSLEDEEVKGANDLSFDPSVTHIFPFGLNKEKLSMAIHSLGVPAKISHTIAQADLVLAPKSQVKPKSKLSQLTSGHDLPLHVIKRNSGNAILSFLRFYFKLSCSDEDLMEEATREIHKICTKVMAEKQMLEADPHPADIRKLQHEYAEECGLNSMSVGSEPNRRVRVYPGA